MRVNISVKNGPFTSISNRGIGSDEDVQHRLREFLTYELARGGALLDITDEIGAPVAIPSEFADRVYHEFRTFECFLPNGDYYATADAVQESAAQLKARLVKDDGFHPTIVLRERGTYPDEPDDEGRCTDPAGHDWQVSDTDRTYCTNCGADGDG